MKAQHSGGLTTGIVVSEVTSLNADGVFPETIKVTPAGRVNTRDGRTYMFEPAALAARFREDGLDLPVDLDHATSRRAISGERADAVGWIKDLSARPDGLFARVEWLEAGRETLAARSHRYVSPTFQKDANGRAIWLHSVALVTAPALAMPAIADAATGGIPRHGANLNGVANALGLEDGADEASIIAKIESLKVDGYAALSGIAGAVATLNKEQAERRMERLTAKVEAHLEEGWFPPALRAWALSLCDTNEAMFDHFIATVGKPPLRALLTWSSLEGKPLPEKGEAPSSDLAANLAQQLGIDPGSLS